MTATRLLAPAVLALVACDPGTPECGRGFFPRGGQCLPFAADAEVLPPRGDGGTRDGGPIFPDAGDAGFPDPIDAAIHDSGFAPEPPLVMLGERGRILLTGDAVLTMAGDNVFSPGEVYVEGSRIACVGARGSCAGAEGASVVETRGVILPGLIDSHNHLAYNWLPEWTPGRLFGDHQQWQGSSEYSTFITPYRASSGELEKFCAMAQWGELRSLFSGATTMYGAVDTRACLRWLVRNAELSPSYNGFGQDRVRSNVLGIDTVDEEEATALKNDMDVGTVAAYMIHLAEGLSARAHEEWTDLLRLGLLRPETVIIHGTALTAEDLGAAGAAGAKLVWSPSSNMALYGDTTNVEAALEAGISVSIAPDWTPSGADTMLAELRFARALIAGRWPGLFTDRELLEAGTRSAAINLAIDRDVGTLEVGKYADLLVLAVDPASPYSSAIDARSHEVRLVMVGGVPTFGDPDIVGGLRETPNTCHDLTVCNVIRRACWDDPPSGAVSPRSIAEVIRSFYPEGPQGLFECE